MTALFERHEDGFSAAPWVRGPWDERLMHGGAPSALLAQAVQAVEPGAGMAVCRLTIDFLSGVPVGSVQVAAAVAKPGRRFQVVEATLDAGGRRACLARAVRLAPSEPARAAAGPGAGEPLPPPEEGQVLAPFVAVEQEMFYPDGVEIRHVRGGLGSGAVAAWIRLRGAVVAGERTAPVARAAAAADFANGLSWTLSWDEWSFANTDLTIHLHRQPQGEWIGVDARTVIDASGTGVTTGSLHDRAGPVGSCAQVLFVQPR